MADKTIRAIEKRLARLEAVIFGQGKKRPIAVVSTADDFQGPSGGVRLLISKGFFKTKKNLADVRAAFEKNGYHYVAAVIQTALNRQSTRKGRLATFKEGGKKLYAARK